MSNSESQPSNFIRDIIARDNESGKFQGRVITRFPPEPNGYLHIGHAKSICLNFGVAAENKEGRCHLRFDDTNPLKEEVEYVDSIIDDVHWLGFNWGENLFYSSDYYERLFNYALDLINKDKAYVCSLSADEMRTHRGTLTEPGKESPYRNRTIAENLDLFQRMRDGEFKEGEHVLRAKIDMASGNLNLRDPVIYRVLKADHHRTGRTWPIYPMYDFAHCLSDSIEEITHSLCTLEFEDHRPLYDWILDALEAYHPQQIEFARLNLSYTILSKRKLIKLVNDDCVNGWDDPRMPTISGIRRRGFTPESIRNFCSRIGVAKAASVVDTALLEYTIRENLNEHSHRRMAVLKPLKVIITNYPEDQVEEFEVPNHPNNPDMGTRKVPFSRAIYIEQDDFMEEPPKKFFRLGPGREVRLRAAYFITCEEVIKDEHGTITELRCSYDPASRGGASPDGRKVKGTMHWVSAEHSLPAEIRLYDRLFTKENPDSGNDEFTDYLNPDSLQILTESRVEPSLADSLPESRYQFERTGYFCVDRYDSIPGKLVFNRTVTLRDSWAKRKAG